MNLFVWIIVKTANRIVIVTHIHFHFMVSIFDNAVMHNKKACGFFFFYLVGPFLFGESPSLFLEIQTLVKG